MNTACVDRALIRCTVPVVNLVRAGFLGASPPHLKPKFGSMEPGMDSFLFFFCCLLSRLRRRVGPAWDDLQDVRPSPVVISWLESAPSGRILWVFTCFYYKAQVNPVLHSISNRKISPTPGKSACLALQDPLQEIGGGGTSGCRWPVSVGPGPQGQEGGSCSHELEDYPSPKPLKGRVDAALVV